MKKFLLLVYFVFKAIHAFPGDEQNTSDTQGSVFSFGVIADIQYIDREPQWDRHYRNSLNKLKDCVNEFNKRGPAFVVELGDSIDGEYESFDAVLTVLGGLKSPVYHLAGNHDYAVGYDEKDTVHKKLDMQKEYYDFTVSGWRFVVLDGNDISTHRYNWDDERYDQASAALEEYKTKGRISAKTWNGAVGEKQLAWLDETLAKADKSGEKVVIFCHYPVYPKHGYNLWNDEEVLAVLFLHPCVVAYMNGHNHTGYYGEKNGIHFLTIRGMIETKDTNAFALVNVYNDHLSVTGFGREKSRELSFKK